MPNGFNQKLGAWLVAGFLIATVLLVYVIGLMNEYMGADMSAHGWAALVAGVVASFIVGGGLTGILVWSRRNGYDEAAHEASLIVAESGDVEE